MQVTALPGRRSETEAWLRSLLVAAELPDAGIVRYRHWDTNVEVSVPFEAARLTSRAPQLVIAKSLGTVVAATAFCLHQFRPTAAVLIGTPYQDLASRDLFLLQRFANGVETLFIQQVEDPGGSAARLPAALQLVRGEVAAIPGDDHLYSDTPALVAVLQRWKKKQPGL